MERVARREPREAEEHLLGAPDVLGLDREDLGMMIHKILSHPRLRDRLARMGAHKARSLFTWTGIAQQLVALVERRSTESFALTDTEWDEPWNDAD